VITEFFSNHAELPESDGGLPCQAVAQVLIVPSVAWLQRLDEIGIFNTDLEVPKCAAKSDESHAGSPTLYRFAQLFTGLFSFLTQSSHRGDL